MLAIVLVGGFGTRMRPLTHSVPKPMLPVGHVPMIERLVGRLACGGVTDVVLALGFKPEPFQAAFPDGVCHTEFGDVALHYAVEPEPLDTGGAIRFAVDAYRADHEISGPTVVANGDVVTDLNVGALVESHTASGRNATLHLTAVDDPSAFGVVDVDDDGTINAFVEKPAPGAEPSNLINAGTYVFEPSIFELIPAGERVSIERNTFPLLVSQRAIGGVMTDDYWLDAGRPELYLAANLDLIKGVRTVESAVAVHADAEVDPEATVVDSLIGPGACVEAGTTVVDTVVLPGAFIGARSQVESSIVMGRVGEDATLIEAVVGAEGVVADGDVVAHSSVPDPGEA